ncbi:alpha/beta-hydrolase [Basidiobolus meristosporus CBS 931.73]|uniref:Alpha/beta-hydrolase n=1 Tax=Basidiobolus meristosporus CBS 931.73 TaxID=1314790 RepID=A0A1Y1Z7G3_9FUNG|nr:alpha/beta-hydrolase [Basidiobolus meristosporus CBS 931.73]|eukprot:ORY05745.1 alpha/beta-hydrolase [Basidiobolus meristosporus CBS 931.73]
MVKKTQGEALVINYRLAPQDPFPFAIHDAIASYLYLLEAPSREGCRITPQNIAIVGDSAGGGLTIATLLALRKMELAAPACAIGISPWVDLTHSMASIRLNAKSDYIPANGLKGHITSPLISGKKWIGRTHYYAPNNLLTHPLVSPLFETNLGALPPLLIQVGDGELLRDEGILFALKASGNYQPPNPSQFTPTPVSLEIYEEMPHVFHMFTFATASKIAFEKCAHFMRKVIQKRDSSQLPDSSNNHLSKEIIHYHGNVQNLGRIVVGDEGKSILLSY